jgi:pantoate--beta-alanine ligase
MLIAKTIAEVRAAVAKLRGDKKCIGLVPTMGALHEGHLSLVRAAKAHCSAVVVTIFVNPTQFGPKEDFAKYPRTLDEDCALLEKEAVDVIFVPEAAEIYPPVASTVVEVAGISDRLDGVTRPGHFVGVATVVAKLFTIVQPDHAFFGQKDAAQVAVLRRMVRDLHFNLELIVCPIVREADGLAMSSRNRYLSVDERQQALVLRRALRRVEAEVAAGVVESQPLIDAGLAVLADEPEIRVDYFSIVDPETLEEVPDVTAGALVAVAAAVGLTRLIDNVLIPPR